MAGAAKARVRVEVVEPMGNEIYVYFQTTKGGPQYVARVDGDERPKVGQAYELYIDTGKLQFFDKETEQVI
ncbi:hypothetical protein D3C83_240080 [compost metagenome]